MKAHRGTLILILSIVSCFFCGIFTSIPAWIMGSSDLKEMDAGTMDPAGRGMTNAGKIIGMIYTILFCLGMLAWGAWFLFIVILAAAA